ncbi:group 1 truncated hemoglobin [Aliidiomarina shirensis]|uniref:Group 1 truncated hemoglobin n=1 Tax=Aliidiomarina shirensis TaxID=1048642 RepID=A0A432WY76_9GAMM|nr:group 1 truncated hemoglobin [Aliidiomarina shirensis]RUO38706.1 group 1 truncated hemoglobin [Aliidiomarina shirensis]
MNKLLMVTVLFAALLMAPSQADARDDHLYNELGGTAGIEQIVEDLLFNSIDDRRIRHHFEGVDMVRLHEKLSEQICELAGGPCVYTGDDMVKSHTGMGVTRGDFNALVEALQLAMDDNEVSVPAQNRLLARLASMYDEIVGL